MRGKSRPIPTGSLCSRSTIRIPSRMVVAFPSSRGDFFRHEPDRTAASATFMILPGTKPDHPGQYC